jgi:hypothetical protein
LFSDISLNLRRHAPALRMPISVSINPPIP